MLMEGLYITRLTFRRLWYDIDNVDNISLSSNVPSDMCTQRKFRSACAFVVWSESALGAFWIAKDATFLHADNEDWSDCADAETDLSLRGARMSEGTSFPVQLFLSL